MADLTSLQAASAIQQKVSEVMVNVILPQLKQDVDVHVQMRLVDAVRAAVSGNDPWLERIVRDEVRKLMADRIEIEVTVKGAPA